MGWALRGEVCTPPSLSQMHILHLNQNRLAQTLVPRWRKKKKTPSLTSSVVGKGWLSAPWHRGQAHHGQRWHMRHNSGMLRG